MYMAFVGPIRITIKDVMVRILTAVSPGVTKRKVIVCPKVREPHCQHGPGVLLCRIEKCGQAPGCHGRATCESDTRIKGRYRQESVL